eukprot:Lithocolla_globosa_v1_NODE_2132_length_2151_cov_5.777195.p3 type:complete len:100 gc:universal NODE_2132_length_2151_cov_5.777195:1859-1560(-)
MTARCGWTCWFWIKTKSRATFLNRAALKLTFKMSSKQSGTLFSSSPLGRTPFPLNAHGVCGKWSRRSNSNSNLMYSLQTQTSSASNNRYCPTQMHLLLP